MKPDTRETLKLVDQIWNSSIVPTLHDYIRIPNQSPAFDPDWAAHGHMDRAVQLAAAWAEGRKLQGCRLEVLRLPGRTPLILAEVEGRRPGTVMMYGHLDKQPPFEGWDTARGLGPWTPVEIDGRLYGRGGADDGYAIFAAFAAAEALQKQGVAHPRLVMLIECSEESGSPDLPAYVEAYGDRIGNVDLVVCLDSGCGDYERLWTTTSLRGLVTGNLHVSVLSQGVHSGDAGGVVPSSFRVLRHLLERLENAASGAICPPELHAAIPPGRLAEADRAAEVLGETIWKKLPLLEGMHPVSTDPAQLILNRAWRPSLSVTAAAGLPAVGQGGNVLRPSTTVRLALRLPPSIDGKKASVFVRELLESDPPYGATVKFEHAEGDSGWEAPPTSPWLQDAVSWASGHFFGNPTCALGEGGSIPFMGILGRRFPAAQFLITGVLGPHSNAHGPNEFLELRTARALTAAVAHIIDAMPSPGAAG